MASCEFYSGNSPEALPCVEGGSTQAFKRGDLIKFSSGVAVIATDGVVQGIAACDAVGTTSSAISYYRLSLDNLYVMRNSTTTAQTDVGSFFQVRDFTAAAMTVTASTNGQSDFFCVGLDPRDAVGTSGGRMILVPLPAAVEAT